MNIDDYKDLYGKLIVLINNQNAKIDRLESELNEFKRSYSLNNIAMYNRWVDDAN